MSVCFGNEIPADVIIKVKVKIDYGNKVAT